MRGPPGWWWLRLHTRTPHLPPLWQLVKASIAAEKAQLDILTSHFALVDSNTKAAGAEAAAAAAREAAVRAAENSVRVPAVELLAQWWAFVQAKRALERKAAKKGAKGGGKGKGGKGK